MHDISHFGIQRTLELAREKYGKDVTMDSVKKVVSMCDVCRKIDPAVVHRTPKGALETFSPWERIAIDVTHVNGKPYLSLVDTSSRYTCTVWRELVSK